MSSTGKLRASLFAVVLLFVCGASPALAVDLSGTWTGSWSSCKTNHQGPLSATLTKIDETAYCAEFRGRFLAIMPFRYTTTLHVVEEGDVVALSGSSYLGRLFGTFTFSAVATETTFDANYSSKRDCGKFAMTKQVCCCP